MATATSRKIPLNIEIFYPKIYFIRKWGVSRILKKKTFIQKFANFQANSKFKIFWNVKKSSIWFYKKIFSKSFYVHSALVTEKTIDNCHQLLYSCDCLLLALEGRKMQQKEVRRGKNCYSKKFKWKLHFPCQRISHHTHLRNEIRIRRR